MGILDLSSLDALRIERIIFHVVGPEDSDLILMDEVDVGRVADFFLARIKETNVGNRFSLIGPQQGVWPSLSAIKTDPKKFVQISKELAQQFQNEHRTVASRRGAFIVAQLSGAKSTIFALIKFDDLRVLRFVQQKTSEGGVKATVSEINNTFQENKKAMQKSALIVLSEDGGEVAVFDRANRADVTAYFRAFLGVLRLYGAEESTSRFERAIKDAFIEHKSRAGAELRETWRKRLFDVLSSRETVEPEEDFQRFGSAVFGSFFDDPEFRASVEKALDKHKISGETINVAPSALRRPTTRRIQTVENIEIRVPNDLDAKHIIEVVDQPGGRKEIRILTGGIVENELVDDETARSR